MERRVLLAMVPGSLIALPVAPRCEGRRTDAIETESGSTKEGLRKPLTEERARDAIAREESIPGDKVRMTFRVVLARQDAEALAARAIREEKNIVTLVTEILEAAAAMGQGGP